MRTACCITVLLLASNSATAEPLRTVRDAARHRTWILQTDAVVLHEDLRTRRFELPGWLYAKAAYACPPDLALDARGGAVVTSNVIPVLWRIDPEKGVVEAHELALDTDTDKDVGFRRLRYAVKERAFYAVNDTDGSVWRFDAELRSAHKVRSSRLEVMSCATQP